jgi:DNA topoisomerase I
MTIIERLSANGIRRIGSAKKGFQYQRSDKTKPTRAELERIASLKIPPAWTDVYINPAASGAVQALGKDAAGRWQYLYHEKHVRLRERKKLTRLIRFAQSLPVLRKTVARHLRLPDLPRERVMAAILRILSASFIRPGSQVYADENGSYGIATLRPKHMRVRGDLIIFDFPGKSGVQQHREFRDRAAARIVRELLRHPAREVFKYQNGEGKFVDVKRRHINEYIKEVMGGNFTAKDFRTWAGTLICACALARAASDLDDRELRKHSAHSKRKLVAAIKETAEALGNTPAVCRDAYVCPLVMTGFTRGQVINRYFQSVQELIRYRGVSLHPAEKSLLRFLKQEASGSASRNGRQNRNEDRE